MNNLYLPIFLCRGAHTQPTCLWRLRILRKRQHPGKPS